MARSGRRTKVERLIDEYDLDGLGDELEAAWLGDGRPRASLRQLADEFNRTLLETVLDGAGLPTESGYVENTYRTLTGAEGGERTRARRELERADVPVDEALDSFVSHQAIHTYLTGVRDAALPDAEAATPAEKLETIQRMRGRTRAVVGTKLGELVQRGDLTDRPYDCLVDIQVVCEACGRAYTVTELIDGEGCDCEG